MRFFCFLLLLSGFACTASSVTEPALNLSVEGVEKTIFVADHTVDCVGVAPQTCLLVKEAPEADWTYWYDGIIGFTYEAGYAYALRVDERTVADPPQDASSITWHLLEVISKTSSATTF